MKVSWLSDALNELDRVYEYVASENPQAAKAIFQKIQAAATHLSRFPEIGRPGHVQGTREVVVADAPYVIVYRLVADRIEILCVLHTSKDRSPLDH